MYLSLCRCVSVDARVSQSGSAATERERERDSQTHNISTKWSLKSWSVNGQLKLTINIIFSYESTPAYFILFYLYFIINVYFIFNTFTFTVCVYSL